MHPRRVNAAGLIFALLVLATVAAFAYSERLKRDPLVVDHVTFPTTPGRARGLGRIQPRERNRDRYFSFSTSARKFAQMRVNLRAIRNRYCGADCGRPQLGLGAMRPKLASLARCGAPRALGRPQRLRIGRYRASVQLVDERVDDHQANEDDEDSKRPQSERDS